MVDTALSTKKSSALFFPDPEHVREIVRIHLDPDSGTPYWLRRDERLGAQALHRVRTFDDFKELVGFRDLEEQRQFERDTRFLPIEELIPASALVTERFIWASQTGGTTGPPKHGNWGSTYWQHILEFSDELLDLHGIPRDVNWLFLGPMGPHTTGRLVVSIAEHRGGRCFSIDLDPRIVKIFGTEGMTAAYDRYIRHIWDQVEPILRYQKVGALFCTSRLLEMLPEYLAPELLRPLRGVVHAGTTMERDLHKHLREEVFPGAPVVGMYGTSTTGISYQKPFEAEDDHRVIYIPSCPHVVLQIVDEAGRIVPYGEEGHVATYRLTRDSLIPGFWERDMAARVQPYGVAAERYPWDWIGDPYSPEFTVEGKVEGVY